MVQMVNPGTANIFLDYGEHYASAQLEHTTRIDVVQNVYDNGCVLICVCIPDH